MINCESIVARLEKHPDVFLAIKRNAFEHITSIPSLKSGNFREKKLKFENVIHRDNPLKLVKILSGKHCNGLSLKADFGLFILEHFVGKRFFGKERIRFTHR